jgi:predicted nucleic acid-binding protein
MTTLALDTSVAVPLLVDRHRAHHEVVRWWRARDVSLCGHALAETYSVLTRLPGDLRLTAEDAAQLITERFAPPLVLGSETSTDLPGILARLQVSGGAVYDALVGLAAVEHAADLATRDGRAIATYEAVGASAVIVA